MESHSQSSEIISNYRKLCVCVCDPYIIICVVLLLLCVFVCGVFMGVLMCSHVFRYDDILMFVSKELEII